MTSGSRLSRELLVEEGGPFEIGGVVDLGPTQHVGQVPEHEDHSFDPDRGRQIELLDPNDFWPLLEGSANAILRDIFGPELHQQQRSCVFEENTGDASLGHIETGALKDLCINDWDKLRAVISDDEFTAHVSVTDIRFNSANYSLLRVAAIESMRAPLSAGVPMILSVGV